MPKSDKIEGNSMNPIQPIDPQRIWRPDPPQPPKPPDLPVKPFGLMPPQSAQDVVAALREDLVRLLVELDRIISSYSKQPARAYVALDTLRKQEIFALTQPERFTNSRDAEEARAIHLKFDLFFRQFASALTPPELEQARLCAAYLQDLTRTSRGFQDYLLEQSQPDAKQRVRARTEAVQRIQRSNRSRRNVAIAVTLLAMLLCFLILPFGMAFAFSVFLGVCGAAVYWAFLRQPLSSELPGEVTGEWSPIEDPALRERMEIIRQVMGEEFAHGAQPFLLGPGG
jgi:hypothetical protein